jgi:uncharacterized protein YoxC
MAKMSAVSTAMTMNVENLKQGVKVANDSLKSLSKTAQQTQKAVGQLVLFEKLKLGAKLAAAGIRTLASTTAGISNFVTSTTEALRANIALAESLGISQKEFSGLAQAAKDTGLQVEQLFEPLSKIATLVDNAMSGNEQALALFKELGLSAENLAGMPAFNRIQRIADAIAGIKDLNRQSVVLNKLFGESGQRDGDGCLRRHTKPIDQQRHRQNGPATPGQSHGKPDEAA